MYVIEELGCSSVLPVPADAHGVRRQPLTAGAATLKISHALSNKNLCCQIQGEIKPPQTSDDQWTINLTFSLMHSHNRDRHYGVEHSGNVVNAFARDGDGGMHSL